METNRLSEIVGKYIENKGITYEQFADKCGVSKSYISIIINGRDPNTNEPTNPKLITYKKLAKGMGISLDDLMAQVEGKKRFIRPIRKDTQVHRIPIVRVISKDSTLKETIENASEFYSIIDDYYKDNKTLAYIAIDNALSPVIIENDLIIVWLDEEINDGDIALTVDVTNNALRCYKVSLMSEGTERIIYANLSTSPLMESKSNIRIIGRVVSVQRKL